MTKTRNTQRRDFIKQSSVFALGVPLFYSSLSEMIESNKKTLVCQDIANHFREVGSWVNWKQTTDTFKAGDPTKPVRKIAVAWKASLDAINEAISEGADMLISHESICANADNLSTEQEIVFALPSEKPKFDLLEKSGLVVYRCHDFWDGFPGEGVRDSWQKGLEIGDKIIANSYPFYVTEVPPVTVGELAQHILKQIKPLKQNGVLVSGNMNKIVSKIGTGTGVNVDPNKLWNLGADVGIMTDDYYKHVRIGVHANELDFPTIIVNHGVSEEWGIENLSKYITKKFPLVEVHFIPQYCPYTIIT